MSRVAEIAGLTDASGLHLMELHMAYATSTSNVTSVDDILLIPGNVNFATQFAHMVASSAWSDALGASPLDVIVQKVLDDFVIADILAGFMQPNPAPKNASTAWAPRLSR
jgi:hypothetical protein